MKLIPAIDLKAGCVAHARGGDRQRYRRLDTPLFPSAQADDVIARILSLFAPGAPDTFYLADLDAISGNGENRSVITAIRARFPSLRLWLDAGFGKRGDVDGIRRDTSGGTLTPVVGTETLADDLSSFGGADYVLSLDFGARRAPGDDLLQRPGDWPRTVIALTLDRVGAQCGPDYARLRALRGRYRGRLIAGGGVRDERDLRELQACGIDGALVATAIYEGRLRSGDQEIVRTPGSPSHP